MAEDIVINAIREVCSELSDMLVAKNRAYGNSALEPLRIFSKASVEEQLNVRIDDKLSRILRGDGSGDEDAELDLRGYLTLKAVLKKMAGCPTAKISGGKGGDGEWR